MSHSLDLLSGAIDVVVIEQEDGSLHCTPFHVRFGRLKAFRTREKMVSLSVNGEHTDVAMKVGDKGEVFFLTEVEVSGFLCGCVDVGAGRDYVFMHN